jgi:hypothetical protein
MKAVEDQKVAVRTEVDGLLQTRCGKQASSVASATTGGNDLSSSSMDGIGMKLSETRTSVI